MTDIPTPRTDAEAYEPNGGGECVVGVPFARQLERELAGAKREVEELSRSIRQQQLMDEEILGLRERIRRLEEAGDGLLKAMCISEDSMPYCDWVCMSADAKNNWRKARETRP
jgi:hypothetical protein